MRKFWSLALGAAPIACSDGLQAFAAGEKAVAGNQGRERQEPRQGRGRDRARRSADQDQARRAAAGATCDPLP